jgi:CSLREA domain-containing protein
LLAAGVALPATAATFTVTKVNDSADGTCDADCSLREAIIAANAAAGRDVIVLGAAEYVLSIAPVDEGEGSGDLDVSDAVEIVGVDPTATIVDANQIDRVFDVQIGTTGVTLRNLTITGGRRLDAVSGGGILIQNDATVVIDNCRITGNEAGEDGGGIGSAALRLTVSRSWVSGNEAGDAGGGIYSCCSGELRVTDSAIVDNTAVGGGGLWIGGAGELSNVTVSDNMAPTGQGALVYGGGTPPLRITNSTIYGNTASAFPGVQAVGAVTIANSVVDACSGSITSLGGNVESPGDACAFDEPSDQADVTTIELAIGPLADNGGPTPTRALLPGSVALGAAELGHCPSLDQRGVVRRLDEACDAGAFELPPCSTPALAIPDNDPLGVADTLVVVETGELSDLDLYLVATHPFAGDLEVALEHVSTGTSVVLLDRPQSCGGDDPNLILDDEAAPSAELDCQNGADAFPRPAYRPGDPPASLLELFDGEDLAGEWRLTVADHAQTDTGTLVRWCLLADSGDYVLFENGFESGDTARWSTASP